MTLISIAVWDWDMWLFKIKAAAKHFMVTLLIICLSACLVFLIWYPGIYSRIMPGTQLFIIVACVEVILGPCMTLVIFNPQKSLKELLRDYAVIVSIQVAALGYGIFSVSQVRPVYTALNGSKLQVVAASEIESDYMAESGEFAHLPWLGPVVVCLRAPANEAEKALALELSGKGFAQYEVPKYFKVCDKGQLSSAAKSMAEFRKIANDNNDNDILKEFSKIADIDKRYVWMPITSRFSTSIALINIATEKPEYFLDANKKLH